MWNFSGVTMIDPMPIVLVFRVKTGCRQYPFYNVEELEKFMSRKPYRNEYFTFRMISREGRLGETLCASANDVVIDVKRLEC